jgi:hypothetical protein
MENNIENAMDLGAEVLEDIPKVKVSGRFTIVGIVGLVVVTGGLGYVGYRLWKKHRKEKGIIDGEILGVENDLTEE